LALSHWLQRRLEIGEIVELDIGSDTHLLANNITLANPAWTADTKFISVQRLEVRFNIPSLWQDGPILIDTLSLTGLELELVNPDDHTPNWALFPNSDPKSRIESDDQDQNSLLPLLIKHGHSERSKITYKDADQDILVTLKTLDIAEPRQGELLAIELHGSLNEIPVDAIGHLGPSAALLNRRDLQLDLRLNWGQLEVISQGTIGDMADLSGSNFHFRATSPISRPLLDALGMQEVRDGPLLLEGTLTDNHPGIAINVDGRLENFDLHLSGHLQKPGDLDGIDVEFALGGPSLHEVGAMFELSGLPDIPYEISGKMTRHGSTLSIREGLINAGNSHLVIEGSLPEFPEIDGWEITMSGGGVDLALIGPLIGVEDLPVVPYKFSGEFQSNDEGIELINFHIDNSISELEISGIIGEAPTYSGSGIELKFSGSDLASTGLWLGLHNLPSEPFTIDGKLLFSELGWKLTNATFDMQAFNVNISGEIEKLFQPSNLIAEFQLNSPNLATTLANFGFDIENFPAKPISLSGKLSGTPTDIEINHAKFTSGSSSVSLSGKLGDPSQLTDIELSLHLKTPDLMPFLPLPNEEGRPRLPIEAKGTVKLASTQLIIEKLVGKIGNAAANLSGQFNLSPPYDNSYIKFDASTDHLGGFLAPWLARVISESPFNVSLDASYDSGGIQIKRLDANLGSTMLTGKINIDDVNTLENAKGEFHVSGPSSKILTDFIDLDLDAYDSEYSVNVNIAGSPDWLHLDPISVDWGKSDYSGSILIKPGNIPTIQANLHSNLVHLPFLFPTREELQQRETAEKLSGKPFDESVLSAQLTEKELSKRMIPDTRINLGWLSTIQGSVKYHANKIYIREDAIAAATIDISILDGVLFTRKLNWDGPFTAGNINLRIDAHNPMSVFNAEFEMQRIPLLLLLGGSPEHQTHSFYKGHIETKGNTIREVVRNSTGTFVFKGGGGKIDNKGIDLILGDVLEQMLMKLNPYSKNETTSNMICHAGAMKIENGEIILAPGLVVRTDKLDIASAGTINLRNEKLNLALRTRSRSGIGISASKALTPYFKIGGTLAYPRLAINAKGAVVSGSAAAATAGLSIIAGGLWDRWIATAKNPCERIFTNASVNDKETYGPLLD
jgi:hypothetical protein